VEERTHRAAMRETTSASKTWSRVPSWLPRVHLRAGDSESVSDAHTTLHKAFERRNRLDAPAAAQVVRPPKELDLPPLCPAADDALDHVVQLVRLARRLAHLGEEDLRVEALVEPGREPRRGGRVGGGLADGDEAVLQVERKRMSARERAEDESARGTHLLGVVEPVTGATCAARGRQSEGA